MTTTADHTLTAIELLKAGAPVADIVEQTGLSTGQIAALAEAQGLTAAHTRQTVKDLIEALAWGEKKSSTKKAQNLAARARTALTELVQLRRSEVLVAQAETEIDQLRAQLAQAEQKLRAAKGVKPAAAGTAQETKQDRQKIREWARRNGHYLSDHGVISQTIRDAYANRDQDAG